MCSPSISPECGAHEKVKGLARLPLSLPEQKTFVRVEISGR
jgi:hypothetical protein